MEKREILNRYTLHKLGDDTVFIQNSHFNFSYTVSDHIVKPEFIGKHRYFGGLQCNYSQGSKEYIRLEEWLVEIAEKSLLI